jgi:alkanesulfonate monooxygenase
MHPFAVAKMVATLGFLHGRRLYLNMVAGGYKGDLNVLHDPVTHDERYDRLVEYTHLVRALLAGDAVTFAGRYFQVTNARLAPALSPELMPGVFVSGSSDAGLAAARALGATAVQYPEPAEKVAAQPPSGVAACGIRVGIIAREDPAAAWRIARERFPEDRRGKLTHELAMKLSDSAWHRQLSALPSQSQDDNPYWMVPFEHYKTFCPYLVGGYDRVAAELARYLRIGFGTVILDVPASAADLDHANEVLRRAAAIAVA